MESMGMVSKNGSRMLRYCTSCMALSLSNLPSAYIIRFELLYFMDMVYRQHLLSTMPNLEIEFCHHPYYRKW
jgi:hypothetical protein